MKSTTALLEFWEEQMRHSHTSSNFFFRKSPSHYHMMLIIMAYHKLNKNITVEKLKIKDKKLLIDAMLVTIAGIAAAMKNVG